jgi:hypothetical protein
MFPDAAPEPQARARAALPWLDIGAIAAVCAGALAAASSAIDRGGDGARVAASVLAAATAPMAVVLVAFLYLADATHEGPLIGAKGNRRPNGLRRSSICLFLTLLVLVVIGTAVTVTPKPSLFVIVLSTTPAGLALAVLAGFAIEGRGLGVMFLVYLAAKCAILAGLKDYPYHAMLVWGMATSILLASSLASYGVWFAVVLLRRRLGPWATVLGWLLILNVVMTLGLVGGAVLAAWYRPVGATDPVVDSYLAPYPSWINLIGVISEITLGVVTALLLRDARRRLSEAGR